MVHHSAVLDNSEEIKHNSCHCLVHDGVPVYYSAVYKIISESVNHVSNRLSEGDKYLDENAEFKFNSNDWRDYWTEKHHEWVESLTEVKVLDGNDKKS